MHVLFVLRNCIVINYIKYVIIIQYVIQTMYAPISLYIYITETIIRLGLPSV